MMKGGFAAYQGPLMDNAGNVRSSAAGEVLRRDRHRARKHGLPRRGRDRLDLLSAGRMRDRSPIRRRAARGCLSPDGWLAALARRSEASPSRSARCWSGSRRSGCSCSPSASRRPSSTGWSTRPGFGTAFSWQNTLSRTAPLLLAALCVALPARLGLVVIGGEGAIVLGGVAAGALAAPVGAAGRIAIPLMALAGALVGAVWIGAVGALRHARGVNETIASLLMAYIAIALMNHLVEGPFRDPASLNKPSTAPLAEHLRIGDIPGWDVHWGLVVGIVLRPVLGADRAHHLGLRRPHRRRQRARRAGAGPAGGPLIIGFTALGGAFAGLAGVFEVAAVHGSANASLASATAIPASSSPFWRGTIRWPSSPSRCCWRGSRRPRA
jgi:hypothetical protein